MRNITQALRRGTDPAERLPSELHPWCFEGIVQRFSLGGSGRITEAAQIASALSRFKILSDTFITDPGFQQTLAVYYDNILLFHKHAYKFVRRSGRYPPT